MFHRKIILASSALLLAVVLAAPGCGGGDSTGNDTLPHSNGDGPAPFDPDDPYTPDVDPTSLSPEVTNLLFPLPVGAQWTFVAETDEGIARIETAVDASTEEVFGATVRVVRDTEYHDDVIVEDTFDWFAQDDIGHVWYMGEDTTSFEGGEPAGNAGSWEAGVDGALPGVQMLADPAVGDVYRQEFYEGEAEDIGEVVGVGETVSVPAGDFDGCVKTRDRSAIEDADEFKYYCPGVGLVLEEEDGERVELTAYSGL